MRALDTYVGRRVTAFSVDTDNHWFVELEGGIRVVSNDKNVPAPDIPAIVGRVFVAVLMSDTQTQMVIATFTQDENSNPVIMEEFRVTLNPTQYSIYDPTAGQSWSPQAGTPPVEVPPYPAERDVVGPDNEGVPQIHPDAMKAVEEQTTPQEDVEADG